MKTGLLRTLGALCVVLAPSAAHAQAFSVPRDPTPETTTTPPGQPPATAGGERLRLGVFWSQWDNNLPNGKVTRLETALSRAAGSAVKLGRGYNGRSSSLIAADYFVTRNISVGGWWNPTSGTYRSSVVTAAGVTGAKLNVDANFWDLHATYYPSKSGSDALRGLSVQVGYSGLHQDLDGFGFIGAANVGLTDSASTYSPNIWLNYARQIAAPTIGKRARPIHLYGGFGYYFSPQFNEATNVIFGADMDITPTLALTGSVWLNDLDNINKRISLGLVGRF